MNLNDTNDLYRAALARKADERARRARELRADRYAAEIAARHDAGDESAFDAPCPE